VTSRKIGKPHEAIADAGVLNLAPALVAGRRSHRTRAPAVEGEEASDPHSGREQYRRKSKPPRSCPAARLADQSVEIALADSSMSFGKG
jgi:hypothetical protein